MSSERYDVVLVGFPNGTSTGEQPVDALARVFEIPIEKAQRYIDRAPVVVRRNAEMGVARHYVNALVYIGALFELRPVDDGAPEEVRADTVSGEQPVIEPQADPSQTQMRGGVPVNLLPRKSPAMMGAASPVPSAPIERPTQSQGGSTQFAQPRRIIDEDAEWAGAAPARGAPNFELTDPPMNNAASPAVVAEAVDLDAAPPTSAPRIDGPLFDAAWRGFHPDEQKSDAPSDHNFEVSGSFFAVSDGPQATPGDAALSGEHAFVDEADPDEQIALGPTFSADGAHPPAAGSPAPDAATGSPAEASSAEGSGELELDFEAARRNHPSGSGDPLWRGPDGSTTATASRPRIHIGQSPPSATVTPRRFHSAEVGLPEGYGVNQTTVAGASARSRGADSGVHRLRPTHPVHEESRQSAGYVTHVRPDHAVMPEGFYASIMQAFLFPLRGTGLAWTAAIMAMAVGSVIMTSLGAAMGLMGLPLLLAGISVTAAFLALNAKYFTANMAGAAYDGDGPEGKPDLSDFKAELAYKGFGLLVLIIVLAAPAGAFAASLNDRMHVGDALVFGLLSLVPYYYLPMAMALLARDGTVTSMWNLPRGAMAIAQVPAKYTVVVLIGFVAGMTAGWTIRAFGSINGVTLFFAAMLIGLPIAYTSGVTGALMGKLLQEHPEVLGD